jgi:hypothetical protein
VEGSCQVGGYAASLGSHVLVASARDLAANEASLTKHYSVHAWTMRGFYQPVDMNGVLNVVRSGRTVPLKFEVFAGLSERTHVADIASFTQTPIDCATLLAGPTGPVELSNTGGTELRYADGQFVANWKTPSNSANTCWVATVTTIDGSRMSAFFKLK